MRTRLRRSNKPANVRHTESIKHRLRWKQMIRCINSISFNWSYDRGMKLPRFYVNRKNAAWTKQETQSGSHFRKFRVNILWSYSTINYLFFLNWTQLRAMHCVWCVNIWLIDYIILCIWVPIVLAPVEVIKQIPDLVQFLVKSIDVINQRQNLKPNWWPIQRRSLSVSLRMRAECRTVIRRTVAQLRPLDHEDRPNFLQPFFMTIR